MKRLPFVLTKFLSASRYILRPFDAIRLSVQYPTMQRTFGFLLFLGIVSGLVFLNTVRNPRLVLATGGIPAMPAMVLFFAGLTLGVIMVILLSIIYMLMLRFLHRRNYAYQAVFDAMCPVSLYVGLFFLLTFFSLQTSLLSGMTLLAVALGISHLVQYFVIRQLTNLDENHASVMVIIANMLNMTAMGVLISLL